MTSPFLASVEDVVLREVKISDIYELLEKWRRQQDADRATILNQAKTIEDLERQRGRAVETIEQAFSLSHREGMLFQQIVDEIVRQIAYREGEDKGRIESLQGEVTRLNAHIQGLEAQIRAAIDSLTWALELPPQRSRELANAVAAAIELIVEAKQVFRENP